MTRTGPNMSAFSGDARESELEISPERLVLGVLGWNAHKLFIWCGSLLPGTSRRAFFLQHGIKIEQGDWIPQETKDKGTGQNGDFQFKHKVVIHP